MFSDLEKILVALIVLATIAVVIANGQGPKAIAAAGQFLVKMVGKVNGS